MTTSGSLAALRAYRGNLKGSLTRLAYFVDKIVEVLGVETIQVRLEKLEEIWEKFSTSQGQMYDHADDENYTDPEQEFEYFETKYLMIKSALLSAIRQRQSPDIGTLESSQTCSTQSLAGQKPTSSIQYGHDYLPKIHIEPFHGSYRDWPAFHDMFESMVHLKSNLSPSQKFHFLRSCLRDDALNLLNHIPVSDATYQQAWDRLTKRYNRPRFIINSLLETFMQLPSINSFSAKMLRKISDVADEVVRGLTSLNSLERDPWMIYVLSNKVDPETRQAWSTESVEFEKPTIDQFLKFLERRCEALESCRGFIRESNRSKAPTLKSMHVSSSNNCPKCNAAHTLTQCTEFLAMCLENKRELVKSKKLCFNCLRSGHNAARCQSKFRCKNCNSRHHTLVHLSSTTTPVNNSSEITSHTTPQNSYSEITRTSINPSQYVTNHSLNSNHFLPQTLLPTAVGKVLGSSGHYHHVRMLIDSGSQVSFITESCAQKLGLKRRNARIQFSGIGTMCAGKSRGLISMLISSRFDAASISVNAYILSTVTSKLPTTSFNCRDWDHVSKLNLNLADPLFNVSGAVDILLGADVAWDILQGEIIRNPNGYPVAHKTIFGWVLAGQLSSGQSDIAQANHVVCDIDSILQSFWNIEEIDPKSVVTKEDQEIDKHFLETHKRDKDGRYVVRLPFKTKPNFADTLTGAVSCLKSLERRFSKNGLLHKNYSKFMDDYLALGHMRKIPPSLVLKPNVFYLPHHAVFKPDSVSTKLRVVFNGSFADSNGNSLNQFLMIGPPIQRDIFSVHIRFRRHQIVFTADVVKMFRQIRVADEDCDFQRIVWRKSSSEPIEHYCLTTVTYGTSCAPYEAVRVLQQIALDYRDQYPVAADILLKDTYVDDIVSGGTSISDARFKQSQLIELLANAGLELSKWQSNSPELLPEGDRGQCETVFLDSELNAWVKVLGMYWNSKQDCFSFRIHLTPDETFTKRQILKDVARIFDPLGFLAPSVVQLKILLQELWLRKLDWDDQLPDCIAAKWSKLRKDLPVLTSINVSRHIGTIDPAFQLHGFSDASASAYSAVIYSRYTLSNGEIQTNIVAAKTRVAPIKQLTIPRLELCGALLLARLLAAVQKSLDTTFSNVYAWCDSQVVLSWLSCPSRRWDIFVGNRTSEILNTIPRNRWFHIRTDQNPADCASRGIAPSALIEHSLWWTGPHWLKENKDAWPIAQFVEEHPTCKQEERKNFQQTCVAVRSEHPFEFLSSRVSAWNRLVRSVAYLYRFVSRCRKGSRTQGHQLLPHEIYDAKRAIIKWLQNLYFGEHITYYAKYGHFGKNCTIANLNPFFDNNQVLRVGGRIQEADVSFNVKHPIIIPKGHTITKLIAKDAHERFLHPGVSTLFSLIRQEFWIIGSRNLLRKITHDCIKCFRQRKSTTFQIMGNLPAQRIQATRPFTHCGCDYAGPIPIKIKLGRKVQTTKGYISLFVCLATKAIHLELVSDLTTETFLAALRRFIARRGKPSHMYSDNGTNFRGSAKVLSEMHKLILCEQHNTIVAESLARDSITWHFIPPSAPHFGGLWEAGVKSVKQHLRRVIGSDLLNFEHLYTLLTQIEAILNSRPLCQISDNDLDPLTPAHFILGESYSAVPEPSLEVPINRLSNWQALQNKIQGYWKRWSMEYLTSLQHRPRWAHPQINLQLNDLVVIKDSNLPPGKWAMGRIIFLYPGKDGHVRVVKLKTAAGELLRPIHKLALLPTC